MKLPAIILVFFIPIAAQTGKMVKISAGEFIMGSWNGNDDEKPPHRVVINTFFMSATEITQTDYVSIMDTNTSLYISDSFPVEQVSWFDAIRYCNRRSKAEKLMPCYDTNTCTCDFSANGYRLPTEAEWEYACRAGTNGMYYWGNNNHPDTVKLYAWQHWNTSEWKYIPIKAGQLRPNDFGLYDIAGNVSEWCNDWYNYTYFSTSPSDNPHGPENGKLRAQRGGVDFCNNDIRSASRLHSNPEFRLSSCGFRVVRSAK
jgi:formylglycine-generating enzyme required for sulfatase activity